MALDDHLTDDVPGFDAQHFNQSCSREDCDGHLVLDHMAVTSGPTTDSMTLSVITRCLGEFCGHRGTFEPAIDEDAESHLRQVWDTVSHEALPGQFYPWSEEHTDDVDAAMDACYTADEREVIEQRLEDLGYW